MSSVPEEMVDQIFGIPPLKLLDPHKSRQINKHLSGLHFTAERVRRIERVFRDELEKGIHEQPSSLQMENTYIPELTDGTEEGLYMALDLGGTNLRVLVVELRKGVIVRELVSYHSVALALRMGPGQLLFDFLAQCIDEFIHKHCLHDVDLPLGFTFSFPMRQHSLHSAELVIWTKTFNSDDCVGRDVVFLLNEALHRRGITRVRVVAILNDTTGTLVQGAVLDPNTAIGLILGTGSNACYLERADRVQHWEGQRHGEKQVIIDIEWGAFGDNGVLDFIKTESDIEVDNNSVQVRSFTFEKYISGNYLGEVVRCHLVRLCKANLLFNGKISEHLLSPYEFTTDNLSAIEEDNISHTGATRNILDRLGITDSDSTEDDIVIIQHICRLVSNRAALLTSICLAVLINRLAKPQITIAVDGSLYKHHPRIANLLDKYISVLAPERKFRVMLAEDGSGKGAGIVAAIATKLEKRFSSHF